MTNIERQAVDIIAERGIDYRQVCIEIAKAYPEVLVECTTNRKYIRQCTDLMRENKKIPAIKLWRKNTGDTLADAKWSVENLLNK